MTYALLAVLVWFVGMVAAWVLVPEEDQASGGAMVVVLVWPVVAAAAIPIAAIVVPCLAAAQIAKRIRKAIGRAGEVGDNG